MPATQSSQSPSPKGEPPLPPLLEWEASMIDIFVRAASMIGIPKSLGQIYGLLFCSDRPLPMDEIMQKLSISKGSASQGLKTLRGIGAVKPVYIVGDRRDHYTCEIKLRRLVGGFLSDQVNPHLASGSDRLDVIEAAIERENPSNVQHARERLKTLRSWHAKTNMILPAVQKFL
ncbi:MAG: hypothetical protein AAGF10_01570 [Verrucomicrobiota bacterium]